jgi:hypothetical protein
MSVSWGLKGDRLLRAATKVWWYQAVTSAHATGIIKKNRLPGQMLCFMQLLTQVK